MIPFGRKQFLVYLGSLFLAGAAAGGFTGYSIAKSKSCQPRARRDFNKEYRQLLRERLNLSAEQMEKIDPILAKTEAAIYQSGTKCLKQIDGLVQNSHKEMAEYLTTDQQVKLEELDRNRQEFWRQNRGGIPHAPVESKEPPKN
jgi:hypothetical protein